MDETTSYGSVLNLLLKHPKPLSYITTGQNVPDDIEVASIERLVNSVVGADHNA
jgi:flagellar biosynthesis protein FlhF